MTEAAAEHGYEACRVEDVLLRSELSRSSFYFHFPDKRACFMAAFEEAIDALLATATEAMEGSIGPEARVEAGIEALLGSLAEDPAMAQVTLVEIRTTGPEGREHYDAASKRFAELLADGECLRRLNSETEMEKAERAVGAVTTVLWMEIGAGRTERLRRLTPALVAIVARGSF